MTLCFDLDGTLVDTAPDLIRVLNDVIAMDGLPKTNFKEARKAVGFGSRALISEAFMRAEADLPPSRLDELQQVFLARYAEDIAALSEPYAGVEDVLDDLVAHGARLTVCTNKPGYLARPLIKALGMNHYFDRVVGGDEPRRKKPHADHIFAAADHRRARDIVMVGDSYPDMRAAHNARVPAILVTYGYTQISPLKLKADRRIGHFRALPSALESLRT
ncbi:HAD family hydrolase [Litorimonas sp. RW-G-Af-16]|uniref:HAD family hydrolase n=1 Tax=Litorimonas sp. RW-G-Af-16 TaxID=3241168 RepID=UPI00390CB981